MLDRLIDTLTRKTSRIRAHRRLGDRAMARHDWEAAARHYRDVLAIAPISTIQVQLGHALKEAGQMEAAAQAYGSVPQSAADWFEARYHLGSARSRLGLRNEAISELTAVLLHNPDHRGAFAELLHLNAREALPEHFPRAALPSLSAAVADDVARLRQQLNRWSDVAVFPLMAWDKFRQDNPIAPPPAGGPDHPRIEVVVNAIGSAPAYLRATLMSLVDQSAADWSAIIVCSPDMAGHSVASIATLDPRIRFQPHGDVPGSDTRYALHLGSGTILARHALAWFGFVAARTGCTASWCDFDYGTQGWSGLIRYDAPHLSGAFDADLMAQTAFPPPAVLIDRQALESGYVLEGDARQARRRMLLACSTRGTVVPIPRVLATILRLPDEAHGAPNDVDPIPLWSEEPGAAPPPIGPVDHSVMRIEARAHRPAASVPVAEGSDSSIQVIIQTRDAVDILGPAIDTLLGHAANPDRIELTIVDNRSTHEETLAYLNDLRGRPRISVMKMDEPFNWAHANNVAAKNSLSDIVVFANNDITMLTPGWDRLLVGYCERADVGALGVRMLYPDGTIQHAGILTGIGDSGPLHEGARLPGSDTGHLDRLDITHSVTAVTGAFLACRREIFDKIGGFDAVRFPIAYNDVDFCFSVRALGLRILFAPTIELIHHESKTRGQNVGRGRVAWDLGEFASLRRKWPDVWMHEPGLNIQWSFDRPYQGYQEPGMHRILATIDAHALAKPWSIRAEPIP